MKKQWKWLLAALALVAVLVIASALYRSLSERFTPNQKTAPVTVSETETAAAEADRTEEAGEAAEPEKRDALEKMTVPESSAQPNPEPPKEQAADFVVFDQDNAQVRLSDHFGKPLVVNFWASWCGPCCRELPAFDAAAKQYAGNVEFMMVNLENAESVQDFLKENGYSFPVYYDTNENASEAYSIYSIPLTVFIRADGTILDSHIGSMDETTLQNYLTQLTA